MSPQLTIPGVCLLTWDTLDAVFLFYLFFSDRKRLAICTESRFNWPTRLGPSKRAKYKIEHEFIFGEYFASSVKTIGPFSIFRGYLCGW